MTPANATIVTDLLKAAGFDFAVTLPATQVHTLQTSLIESPDFEHVAVSNEGEGAAICAGAWLGGRTPFMVIETSGILVATYALLRCHATFGSGSLAEAGPVADRLRDRGGRTVALHRR